MTRLRSFLTPRWILIHLLVVVLVVVMVNLSFWQFRRLDERQAFNDQVRANATAAPVSLDELLADLPDKEPKSLDEIEWRNVIVTGTFRPADEVIVLNRSQNGAAGVDPLTPLDTEVDGTPHVLMVDRGFVPLSVEVPTPPAGEIELLGRVRLSQERRLGGLTDPAEGALDEVQRIDVERLAPQMAATPDQVVLPFYVDLLESPDITAEIPTPVANPDLSEGSHLSYAIQWLIFGACAALAWVFLVRRALRR
jgi:cytochrome oxidase assembly protein ShyY1